VYLQIITDLRLEFQKLTITVGIDAEEEDNKPLPVTAATTNVTYVNLADLVGEDKPAMLLDLEGWIYSK
jgi:hypothetical protein